MNDIVELGERISTAFDTIREELERLPTPDETARLDALRDELEAEKAASADLRGRLQDRIETLESDLEAATRAGAAASELRSKLAGLEDRTDDAGVQRLGDMLQAQADALTEIRRRNEELQDALQALREAQAAGLANADLINQSMATELEALRTARRADRAELDEIISAIEPMLTEAQNA